MQPKTSTYTRVFHVKLFHCLRLLKQTMVYHGITSQYQYHEYLKVALAEINSKNGKTDDCIILIQ